MVCFKHVLTNNTITLMIYLIFKTVVRKYKTIGTELPQSISDVIDLACEKNVDKLLKKVDTNGL